MAVHLHKFNSESAYDGFIYSDSYLEPSLSVTKMNDLDDSIAKWRINYNKTEYEKLKAIPLTFEITSDGNINFLYSGSGSDVKTIEYSKNGGEWTELTAGDYITTTIKIGTLFFTKSYYYIGIDTTAPYAEQYGQYLYSGTNGYVRAQTLYTTTNDYVYSSSTSTGSSWESCYPNAVTTQFSGTTISVVSGDTVQFRGDNATYSNGPSYYNTFSGTTCGFNLKGNIMSLIDSTDYTTATTLESAYTFNYMFRGCTGLTDASKLLLPATTLAERCYQFMFYGCTNLTSGPSILPATTLATYCYYYMFYDCTSLTSAPELPATTLATYCYCRMFENCTGLTSAPTLPATTLATGCYNGMFRYCTSLTTAPELPATTLADYCYQGMFYGCTNLNYIKCLSTDISANLCTEGWVQGVAANGTFIKAASMASWTTGTRGIPDNWTVQNAS